VASRADTTFKPDAGLASEQARDVRARAWSYVFECFNRHTKKKAAPASGRDDTKEASFPSGGVVLRGGGTSVGTVVRTRGGGHVETSLVRTDQRAQEDQE
jgi:hypothetical protein